MRAEKPKVGVLALGDPRLEVPWIPQEREAHKRLAEELGRTGEVEVAAAPDVVRDREGAMAAVERLLAEGASCLIFHIPVWTFPAITVAAGLKADEAGARIIVHGSGILSGIMASAGALDQVGVPRKLLFGDISEERVMREIVVSARAAHAVRALKGSTYGIFGGRSLGMYTTMADLSQWASLFGIDIEHVDQLEIVRRAEAMPEERARRTYEWLVKNAGLVEMDGKVLAEEKLMRQVKSYLALKDLVSEFGFDFAGIKCQPELSDFYVNQCLSPVLMNDPYDAEGPKEPKVLACEVDHDGALTMQVLKLVSGGKPTLLMDLLHLDRERGLLFCGNCGGMASWYARQSDSAEENLKEVHIRPQVQGKAGGAAFQYVAKATVATVARFFREAGEYRLTVARAEFVEVPREELRKSIWPWAHAVIKLPVEPLTFLQSVSANHIHAVAGDFVEEMIEFCEMLGIEVTVWA